jgi:NhaA family Na+:H+ antiporter
VTQEKRSVINLLQEFSIPLLVGVVVALVAANFAHEWYEHVVHWKPLGDLTVLGHELTLHFLVNDIFMVLFFGIAAKEITESCLPGGSLNPPRKAINPLMATLGGILGPIAVFILGLLACFELGIYDPSVLDFNVLMRGWGVPTVTDIALTWLVARMVFGKGHPAVTFLLLLAVADDAIGLGIIAVFYGDPDLPAAPGYLGLVLLGMGIAYGLRRMGVQQWPVYILTAGPISWCGLMMAHLHPALALAVIVPFLPAPSRDTGLYVAEDEVDQMGEQKARESHSEHSPLHMFEHHLKGTVDFGLFFFTFCNAGVVFGSIGPMTWLILGALVIGKTGGVTLMGLWARRCGFPLPAGMSVGDLVMAGFVAALGLTVALFVATAAFADPLLQGQAKMGALLSGFVGLVAIGLARITSYVQECASEANTSDHGAGLGDQLAVPMAAKGPDE